MHEQSVNVRQFWSRSNCTGSGRAPASLERCLIHTQPDSEVQLFDKRNRRMAVRNWSTDLRTHFRMLPQYCFSVILSAFWVRSQRKFKPTCLICFGTGERRISQRQIPPESEDSSYSEGISNQIPGINPQLVMLTVNTAGIESSLQQGVPTGLDDSTV